ncbi:LacI family transcriptional regulator [Opitutaceae bacterium TAV5]|nr:LacI family transcriptional regulator [Opitutaceae bacterium TAV5]
MEPRRVTVRDIARESGFHYTTVARALRRHSSIPAATCDRICRIAEKMGYAPDPMVAALNAYRVRIGTPKYRGNIVWLTNAATRDGWNTCKTFDLYRRGAEKRANELGYALEDFWLREPGMTERRAGEILVARNVRGLLLAPQPRPRVRIDIGWPRFAAVAFGYTLAWPLLHTITNNTYYSMQMAIRHARRLGYRRPGLVISPVSDERVNHSWGAAFLERQQHWPAEERLPVCRYDEPGPGILSWIKRYKPDVIICHEPRVLSLLEKEGCRIPDDFGFLTQSLCDFPEHVAAVDENATECGRAAVDFLVGMIHRGERGVPRFPQRLLTEGFWKPGKTLPRKRAAAGR